MNRRQSLFALAALASHATLPNAVLAAGNDSTSVIGAAWRGPNKTDPYFAGTLVADWEARTLAIGYALPLPTRPHGLLAEESGGLLICGVRPGAWLLRCDAKGTVIRKISLEDEGSCRLGGHAVAAAGGDVLYTAESDLTTGEGRIGMRDRRTLRKLAEWSTHGIDPHQLLLDSRGNLLVANGGVPRTPADKKIDLHRMNSSLVRLDAGNGRLLGQWRLDDPRLSLRHMAWNRTPTAAGALLGIAMQAEHGQASDRSAAPILAVFDGDRLSIPTRANDGIGYAGDIAAAHRGGFILSSNQAGLAQLWHPGAPNTLTPVVRMQEAYALAEWTGPDNGGGVLVATAMGLGRWHPAAKSVLLPWPQPMALDNHWVLADQA